MRAEKFHVDFISVRQSSFQAERSAIGKFRVEIVDSQIFSVQIKRCVRRVHLKAGVIYIRTVCRAVYLQLVEVRTDTVNIHVGKNFSVNTRSEFCKFVKFGRVQSGCFNVGVVSQIVCKKCCGTFDFAAENSG